MVPCVEAVQAAADPGHLVMLTPQGRRLDQAVVEEMTRHMLYHDRVKQIVKEKIAQVNDFNTFDKLYEWIMVALDMEVRRSRMPVGGPIAAHQIENFTWTNDPELMQDTFSHGPDYTFFVFCPNKQYIRDNMRWIAEMLLSGRRDSVEVRFFVPDGSDEDVLRRMRGFMGPSAVVDCVGRYKDAAAMSLHHYVRIPE